MLHRLSHTRLLRDINVLVLVTVVKEMTHGRVRAVGRSFQRDLVRAWKAGAQEQGPGRCLS